MTAPITNEDVAAVYQTLAEMRVYDFDLLFPEAWARSRDAFMYFRELKSAPHKTTHHLTSPGLMVHRWATTGEMTNIDLYFKGHQDAIWSS